MQIVLLSMALLCVRPHVLIRIIAFFACHCFGGGKYISMPFWPSLLRRSKGHRCAAMWKCKKLVRKEKTIIFLTAGGGSIMRKRTIVQPRFSFFSLDLLRTKIISSSPNMLRKSLWNLKCKKHTDKSWRLVADDPIVLWSIRGLSPLAWLDCSEGQVADPLQPLPPRSAAAASRSAPSILLVVPATAARSRISWFSTSGLQLLSSSVSQSLQPGRPSDAILHLHNRAKGSLSFFSFSFHPHCRSFQNNRMYYLIRVPEKVFFAFIFFHLVLIVSFFVYVLNYYASTNPAAFGMLKNWKLTAKTKNEANYHCYA